MLESMVPDPIDYMNQTAILHISTPLTWRGGEQQLFYLIEALSVFPVKQYLFCPEGSVLEQKVKSLPVEVKTFRKNSGFDPLAAWKLKRWISSVKPDLLHAHDAHAHTLSILSHILGVRKPVILHRRVDFPIRKKWFTLYKYNHRCIRRIICVSHAIEEILAKSLENTDRIVTIHSGFKPVVSDKEAAAETLRKLAGVPPGAPLVGNVSALADHKDYPTFLHTAAQLRKGGFEGHFVIMGDGELKAELLELRDQLDLKNSVHFLGFRENARSLIAGLDCFLFTSKTEGLGTTVLDAMSAGVPVVATRAGGIPEMVKDRQTGLLCEIGDVQSLSGSVLEMLQNHELRNQCVQQARDLLHSFSVDEMARKTLGLYKDVLMDK